MKLGKCHIKFIDNHPKDSFVAQWFFAQMKNIIWSDSL